ncbi:MAG TPA: hypothetical protein VIU46_08420 [Gallionellaceae bacterium]
MNMRCRNLLAALGLCALPFAAQADEPAQSQVPALPVSELWLNPGFYAYHFQKDRHLNNKAAGFGAEYRFSTASSVTAGIYHNSNWSTSHYLGYYWRPLTLGPMRLGAVFGALDGYPGTRKGGWFPAVIPTARVEYGWLGLNMFYIPSYRDSVNGSITFQLVLKVY